MSDEKRPTPIGDDLTDMLARIAKLVEQHQTPSSPACPDCKPGEWCSGEAHYLDERDEAGQPKRTAAYTRRCPRIVRAEVQARVQSERIRLEAAWTKANQGGGNGFIGYDPKRHRKAGEVLDILRRFSAARPPRIGVLITGPTGLGKTRLLLASHLALLEGGVWSEYITARQLGHLFWRAESFDADTASEAEAALYRLRRATVVHMDDLGDIEGDDRRRGFFRSGLKGLLDEGRFVWAAAVNYDWDAACAHPELGEKIMSRLAENTAHIRMDGEDQRPKSKRRAK